MRGQAQTTLTLFKQHFNKQCPAYTLKLPARNRRFYFECPCPFWIVGRTPAGDVVPRQAIGTSDPKKAEAYRQSLLEKKGPESSGASIEECARVYVESRRDIGAKTRRQYELVLEWLRVYCLSRGVVNAADMTVDLMERFKVDGFPKMQDTTRSTYVAKLLCFLRDAYRRDWIKVDLPNKIEGETAEYEQKEPYTDDEIKLILAESLKLSGGTHGYAKQPKTFRLLLELMLETGMRVGDAVRFNPRSCQKGSASGSTPTAFRNSGRRQRHGHEVPRGIPKRQAQDRNRQLHLAVGGPALLLWQFCEQGVSRQRGLLPHADHRRALRRRGLPAAPLTRHLRCPPAYRRPRCR
jgi:Phage integrase SAM-like domain